MSKAIGGNEPWGLPEHLTSNYNYVRCALCDPALMCPLRRRQERQGRSHMLRDLPTVFNLYKVGSYRASCSSMFKY